MGKDEEMTDESKTPIGSIIFRFLYGYWPPR